MTSAVPCAPTSVSKTSAFSTARTLFRSEVKWPPDVSWTATGTSRCPSASESHARSPLPHWWRWLARLASSLRLNFHCAFRINIRYLDVLSLRIYMILMSGVVRFVLTQTFIAAGRRNRRGGVQRGKPCEFWMSNHVRRWNESGRRRSGFLSIGRQLESWIRILWRWNVFSAQGRNLNCKFLCILKV